MFLNNTGKLLVITSDQSRTPVARNGKASLQFPGNSMSRTLPPPGCGVRAGTAALDTPRQPRCRSIN